MARKRDIHPGIWASEQFIGLSEPWARLLFIGCISNADDDGRLKASPAYLKTIIFPGDSCAPAEVKRWRDSLAEQRLIIVYQVDGVEYLALPTWRKYQYVSKYYPSRLPAPPVDDHSVTSSVPVTYHDATSERHLPESDTESDTDPEAEAEAGSGAQTSTPPVAHKAPAKPKTATGPAAAATIKDSLGDVGKAYESNFGMLTPMVGEQLKALVDEYGPDWVLDALSKAVNNERRKLSYVEGILKGWRTEGRGPPGNNGNGRKPATGHTRVPARYTRPEELDAEDGYAGASHRSPAAQDSSSPMGR